MRQDQSFVLYSHDTDHCLSCLLSKNSAWKVLFCTIMISFEKSVSTSQFSVTKVIKFGPCWPLIEYKNTGSYSRGSLPISLSPLPLPLFPPFFPSPSLSPSPFPFRLPFLRLPRRLNLTKESQNVSAAILTIRNTTLFTNHRRMRAVFHHSSVWSKIWNIHGHRDCHTAICICITFDTSCIRPITRNVTRATSLALERGSCVNYIPHRQIQLL